MAKRFTDTDLWDKEWFMQLSPTLKCLVKYVRDKANMAGVWDPNWALAKLYIGAAVSEKDLLAVDEGRQFVRTDDGKIFCVDFIAFQYGEHLNDKSPVHRKAMELLSKHKYKGVSLLDTLLDRVLDTLLEEDKEKEKEEDKPKEESSVGKRVSKTPEAEPVAMAHPGEAFRQAWVLWEQHRREKKKPLTPTSIKLQMKELSAMSEVAAVEMIEHSIAKGYEGLYAPKAAPSGAPQKSEPVDGRWSEKYTYWWQDPAFVVNGRPPSPGARDYAWPTDQYLDYIALSTRTAPLPDFIQRKLNQPA